MMEFAGEKGAAALRACGDYRLGPRRGRRIIADTLTAFASGVAAIALPSIECTVDPFQPRP
jgi:hypothetical protein